MTRVFAIDQNGLGIEDYGNSIGIIKKQPAVLHLHFAWPRQLLLCDILSLHRVSRFR